MESFYNHTLSLINLFVMPNSHGPLPICWDSKCLCTVLYFNKLFVSSSFMTFFCMRNSSSLLCFSFQTKKDEISSVFYPVRKSLSVRSPVSIPDVIATRSGKFVSLSQKNWYFPTK